MMNWNTMLRSIYQVVWVPIRTKRTSTLMVGLSPVRRTIRYLEKGDLLKEKVRVLTVNFNTTGDNHKGARDWVYWYLCQLQYKNPDVQMQIFRNMTPTPFFRVFLDDGRDIVFDVDSQSMETIQQRLRKILGKSEKEVEETLKREGKLINPALFGPECKRHCICEVIGQVPCPGIVRLPDHLRGKKYRASDNPPW